MPSLISYSINEKLVEDFFEGVVFWNGSNSEYNDKSLQSRQFKVAKVVYCISSMYHTYIHLFFVKEVAVINQDMTIPVVEFQLWGNKIQYICLLKGRASKESSMTFEIA